MIILKAKFSSNIYCETKNRKSNVHSSQNFKIHLIFWTDLIHGSVLTEILTWDLHFSARHTRLIAWLGENRRQPRAGGYTFSQMVQVTNVVLLEGRVLCEHGLAVAKVLTGHVTPGCIPIVATYRSPVLPIRPVPHIQKLSVWLINCCFIVRNTLSMDGW